MGSNRKLPFGYQMEMGRIVICPEEAKEVRLIFTKYGQGNSLKTLADEMQNHGITYDRDKRWNKNMIARILEDARYTGEQGFTQIIPDVSFVSIQEKRSSRSFPIQRTEVQKILRQKLQQKCTRKVEEQVLLLLNKVILCPTIIQMPDQSQVVNPPIADKETKLKDVLSELPAKYALSERLVCGECGTLYRRCTWTSRGQKRIVWRCVNRLDHGTKYCKTSPTIPEEPLQEAILKALNTAMSGKDLLSNLHCMYKPADSVFLPGSKIRCGSCKNHSCFLQLLRSKTILPKLLNHLFSLIFQPGNFFCYRSKSLG